MDSKHFSNQLKFIQFLLSRSGYQNVHFPPKKGAESIREPCFQWRTETIHMGWRCSNQVFQDSAGCLPSCSSTGWSATPFWRFWFSLESFVGKKSHGGENLTSPHLLKATKTCSTEVTGPSYKEGQQKNMKAIILLETILLKAFHFLVIMVRKFSHVTPWDRNPLKWSTNPLAVDLRYQVDIKSQLLSEKSENYTNPGSF